MKRLLIVSVIILACFSCKQNHSSTCYRGNASHTGYYQGDGPSAQPKLAWKFKTGGKVFSSPVLYHTTIFVGSDDNCVYALSSKDGHVIWKFTTDGRVSSSAAVCNDVVYINSFDGFLYALNAKDGSLLWKFDMGGDKVFSASNLHGIPTNGKMVDDPWDMYLSSPTVNNGMVLAASGNGSCVAIDAKSGKLVWKFQTGGVIHASSAVSGDSVYIASWDSYIYAINSKDGKEYWRFKTGTDSVYHNQVGFQSSPVIDGKMLYIGCRDAHLYALDRFSGKQIWSYSTNGSWIISSPAVYNENVYFGTSDTYRIISLNASNGNVVFDKKVKSYVFSSPSLANNKLFVGGFSGFLYEVDLATQKIRTIFRTDGSTISGNEYMNADSTLNTNKIFSEPSWDGMLKGVEKLYSMGSILSSPLIDGDRIYFGSTDGFIYALE